MSRKEFLQRFERRIVHPCRNRTSSEHSILSAPLLYRDAVLYSRCTGRRLTHPSGARRTSDTSGFGRLHQESFLPYSRTQGRHILWAGCRVAGGRRQMGCQSLLSSGHIPSISISICEAHLGGPFLVCSRVSIDYQCIPISIARHDEREEKYAAQKTARRPASP